MTSLIIDTSGSEAWVALVLDGRLVAEQSWATDFTVGRNLLAAIDALMLESQVSWEAIQRIGVVTGPGHFGALRTSTVTAQTLAWQTSLELAALPVADRATLVGLVGRATTTKTLAPQYQ